MGSEPMAEVFSQVAAPAADLDTEGAFLGSWRLMSLDGMEWDVPDTDPNRAAFGSRAGSEGEAAFPKIRVVTVGECASHAAVLAAMGPAAGGKGSGEQFLARDLYPRLEEDWLLIADRNFYCWKDWCAAADTGAALLWRVKSDILLPVLELLPDGSYRSVLVNPITDPRLAPAAVLAQAYHQRWEHEATIGPTAPIAASPLNISRRIDFPMAQNVTTADPRYSSGECSMWAHDNQ